MGNHSKRLRHFFFGRTLLALVAIDIEEQILPDSLTQPLLWSGLIANSFGFFTDAESAILGSALGYGCLWSVNGLYAYFRGTRGMGEGDFKLLGAIAAWVGLKALPLIILMAAVSGGLFGLLLLMRGVSRKTAIPFGPFLGLSGFLNLLWREPLNEWIIGIHIP